MERCGCNVRPVYTTRQPRSEKMRGSLAPTSPSSDMRNADPFKPRNTAPYRLSTSFECLFRGRGSLELYQSTHTVVCSAETRGREVS